jgi:hypothetical protein
MFEKFFSAAILLGSIIVPIMSKNKFSVNDELDDCNNEIYTKNNPSSTNEVNYFVVWTEEEK